MLYQLKNFLHWSAVPLDPGDNMKAAEDFLQVVLQGNIVSAAETICTASSRDLSLDDLSKTIVEKFVNYFAITIKPQNFKYQ